MPSRQRSFRVEAIVLRHMNYGEADRMIDVFTREMGKLRVIAKGVRKLRSRKAGHLEPFTCASLQLAKGRELPIVTQAEAVNLFDALRENLTLIGYASYVVELLDRFTYGDGENTALYHLLKDTLSQLASGVDPEFLLRFYELHLLDLLGYRPQLRQCARCEIEIQPQDQYFSAEFGGALCPQCGRLTPKAVPVSLPALKYLRHLQRSNFSQASRADIPAGTLHEMEMLLSHYLTYLLERRLNSPDFIRRVARQA